MSTGLYMNNQLHIKNKKQVNLTIQHSENEFTPLKVPGLGDNPIVFTGSEGIIGDLTGGRRLCSTWPGLWSVDRNKLQSALSLRVSNWSWSLGKYPYLIKNFMTAFMRVLCISLVKPNHAGEAYMIRAIVVVARTIS